MITIAIDKSPFERIVYGFWVDARHGGEISIVFDHYTVETRASKRHKWKVTASWLRLGSNNEYSQARVKRPPLPADIIEQVKAQVFDNLVVVEDYDAYHRSES